MKKLWFKKKSSLHGSGLFAEFNIKKGEQVIEYIGDKVTKKEGDKRADQQIKKAKKNKSNGMVYVFELNNKSADEAVRSAFQSLKSNRNITRFVSSGLEAVFDHDIWARKLITILGLSLADQSRGLKTKIAEFGMGIFS
jgi:hypothetical protein